MKNPINNYARDAAFYLSRHPFCQIFIARNELDEEMVIRNGGRLRKLKVPDATLIHHRHQGPAVSINDIGWWMAASAEQIAWIKKNEAAAIALGLLVPAKADADGKWTSDHGLPARALRTPEYMAKKARRA